MSRRPTTKKSRLEDDLFDPDKDVEETYAGLPLRNELVVATVREVMGHGAYVSLDEYGEIRAYVHISELSRTWVKNIRVHVREGQRIVAKFYVLIPQKDKLILVLNVFPSK